MNKSEQSEIDIESDEMSISESSVDAVLSFVKDAYPQKYKTLSLTKETLKIEYVTNVSYEKNRFFAPSADNASRELDTLLCVINFGNDEGFAIISTQDNQILAVTESGDLSVEDLTMEYTNDDFENNPKAVISNYVANYMSSLPTIPVGPIGPTIPPGGPVVPDDSIDMGYAVRGPWITETQIDPLVQMKLHQGEPYNKYCLNSDGETIFAGCAAIAVIQIMSVNKYPNTIGNLPANWNNIINQYQTNSLVEDTLARLIRTIGGECDIQYLSDSTGTSIIKVKNCLSLYPRYTNLRIITTPQYEDIYPMLQNEMPLYFRGITTKPNNSGRVGHAWVIDGCIYQVQSLKLYNGNNELIGEICETRDYVHCNWGWGGICDGYYITNIFNLNAGSAIPDNADYNQPQELNFNQDLQALTYNFE